MPTKIIKNKLDFYLSNNLERKRFVIDERNNNKIIIDGKKLINFCSNDYLGISQHPEIKKAFIKGIEKYGVGSGASSLISGYFKPHLELEEKFAEFLGKEKAILFNSGYHANLGVITTLANRHNSIIADQYSHASIIDAIILSRAKYFRYKHNNIQHAEKLLKTQENKEKLFITESIFSIDGDQSPINKLMRLAKKYNATTIIDDAHGFGILNTNKSSDYLIIPLGKESLLYYLDLLHRADLSAITKSLNQPIINIHGNKDSIVPKTKTKNIINGAGHIPFITHKKTFLEITKNNE